MVTATSPSLSPIDYAFMFGVIVFLLSVLAYPKIFAPIARLLNVNNNA